MSEIMALTIPEVEALNREAIREQRAMNKGKKRRRKG